MLNAIVKLSTQATLGTALNVRTAQTTRTSEKGAEDSMGKKTNAPCHWLIAHRALAGCVAVLAMRNQGALGTQGMHDKGASRTL